MYTITPGSEQVRYTIERDGFIDIFEKINGKVFANACGPCIGQWNREGADKGEKNTIVHSFNRNFSKRADGNPNTYAFVGSPELVTALAIAGDLTFNPLPITLLNEDGKAVKFDAPTGHELPPMGFDVEDAGYIAPAEDGSGVEVVVKPDSQRLQLLEPFPAWDGKNIVGARVLIKAQGKCTTDHISMAGPWLRYRGHLDNISNNCLIGAENAFQWRNQQGEKPAHRHVRRSASHTACLQSCRHPNHCGGRPQLRRRFLREHAAMEPRHLGVKVVLVKSFARIHETNLKKQGMLAVTFDNRDDYDKIREDDVFDILGLQSFAPGIPLTVVLHHSDGTKDEFEVNHTYSKVQIEWFKAGSALNLIKQQSSSGVHKVS
jgi:aconitate hydratase